MSKPGANDPCPCGSGRKYKKCCRGQVETTFYTRADRTSAFARLEAFVDAELTPEEDEAFGEFWGPLLDDTADLPPELDALSNAVVDMWFAFDVAVRGTSRPVDLLLDQAGLTSGERAFLRAGRRSSMRLYEVVDVAPGTSITLRDVLEQEQVTVNERTASRSVGRHEWLAARVVPRGASGGPELEAGVLHIPRMYRDGLLAEVRRARMDFLQERPGADISELYKQLPPLMHQVWAEAILRPAVPQLRNNDDEQVVFTRVRFEVGDPVAVRSALDTHADLGAESDGAWCWTGQAARGGTVSLGRLVLDDGGLLLETNSVERGARGRALVEAACGTAVRHKVTSHENVQLAVQERIRERALRGGAGEPETDEPEAIPVVDRDAIVLGMLGKHYRDWLDEPVPALDSKTPRAAAAERPMRPRVVDLIQGLEQMYQQALRAGQPAYDPSWMWRELGLEQADAAKHPPPLAHERVAQAIPGLAEVVRHVAARLRAAPGFAAARDIATGSDLAADLELQRFLRQGRPAANETGAEGAGATPYVELLVNFELHRRKAFWVDEALSHSLSETDVDIVGGELRAPFAAFAVVFTDRRFLSLAERLLATSGGALAGQILHVATVYVTERRRAVGRSLDICFALDALGADLPALVRHEVPVADDASLLAHLDAVAPASQVEYAPPEASPLRAMLRGVLNAVIYSTSAGVEPVPRPPPARTPTGHACTFSSDEVFYLPGTIDITTLRQLQELERAPGGREVLKRFMVRGHWRRPQKGWSDQRLRWIEPYWKGPELAAVIEKTYRLKP